MRHALYIAMACWAGAAGAQETPPKPSLFFSPAEVEAINGLLTARQASLSATGEVPVPPPVPPDIHMGALIYLHPNDWVIWLNGVRRTPQNRGGEFEIAVVTPERAELVWRGDSKAGPLRIRLRPYQTFVGTTGEILEGTLAPAR